MNTNSKKNGFRFWKLEVNIMISICVLISFAIFSVHTAVDSIYGIFISSLNKSFNPIWCISQNMELSPFTMAKLFLYQFFLFRLHQVFNNTAFAVSTFKLKCIASTTSICIICVMCISISRLIRPMDFLLTSSNDISYINSLSDCGDLNDIYTTKLQRILQYVGIMLYMVVELIYSIIVLRLFLSRVLLHSMSFKDMKQTTKKRGYSVGSKTEQTQCDIYSVDSKTEAVTHNGAGQGFGGRLRALSASSDRGETPKKRKQPKLKR
eukprot:182171_1